MLNRSPKPDSDLWESSTWEGHARWQLARTLAATPLQRLEWLEEAIEIAWAAGAIRARTPEPEPNALSTD